MEEPKPRTTYELSTEQWVSDTCDLLANNTWPSDKPLIIDMGCGWHADFRRQGFLSMAKALTGNTSAHKLVLRHIIVEEDVVDGVFQNMLLHNQSLRSITLQHWKKSLPHTVMNAVREMTSLEELVLDDCKMENATTLGDVMVAKRSLQRLVLSQVGFVDEQEGWGSFAKSLAKISSEGVERLELNNMRLSRDDLSLLLQAIIDNGNNHPSSSLTHLFLENLGLGSKHASQLAQMLQCNDKLTSLSLRGNNLNGTSIQILAEHGLKHNGTLRFLSLGRNPVGDDGAQYLVDCLVNQLPQQQKDNNRPTQALQRLDLESADIWHKGCLVLAKGLANMVGLERLDMNGNDMKECATEMLQSVSSNMTIQHISGIPRFLASSKGSTQQSSSGSSKTEEEWKKVGYLLRLNRANLRRMLAAPFALSLWPHALERSSNDPDVLFYMLKQAPYIASSSRRIRR